MGKAVRYHAPLALLLQTVVADGFGSVQRLLQIAGFQNILLLHIMAPDAGEAVRLQLHLHRQTVGFGLGGMLLLLANFRLNAQQFLHVVAHLMSNDVPLSKVAVGAQFIFHLIVEGQVDIDRAVGRTVERPHHRLTGAAAGTCRAAVEHQFWLGVLAAHLFKDRSPGIFGGGQNDGSKLRRFIVFRTDGALRGGLLLRHRLPGQHAGQIHAVVARHQHNNQQYNAALPARQTETAAPAAAKRRA